MDPVVRHRYAAGLVGSILLVLIGYLMVVNRSAISPTGPSAAIEINGIIQSTDPAAPIPTTPKPIRPTAVDVPYTKITPPEQTRTSTQTPKNDGFDWNSFVASLSQGATTIGEAPSEVTLPEVSSAYAFIPTDLMSPPVPQSLDTMSDSQKALYGWGSDAGSVILGYENAHPDQAAILTNHMQDRSNPAKIDALKKLGSDLKNVADSINNIGTAPPQMQSAAEGLVAAYRDIGEKLSAVGDARGDEATVKAIMTYNSAAEAFVQKYVNVVLVFQANDVKFTQDEPGGVFMFPGN